MIAARDDGLLLRAPPSHETRKEDPVPGQVREVRQDLEGPWREIQRELAASVHEDTYRLWFSPRDRGERGEPDPVGVLEHQSCQLSLDLAPGPLEVLTSFANLPRNRVLLPRRSCLKWEGAP